MRLIATTEGLVAATIALAGWGGVNLSDSFVMLLLFGAFAVVGIAGVVSCFIQRLGSKAYLIPVVMAVVGIMGCGAALDGR